MSQLTIIKLKDFILVTCILYFYGIVQRTNLVMGKTRRPGPNATTTPAPFSDYSLESEDFSFCNETKAPEMVIFDLDYVLWPFFVDTDKRFNQTYPTLSTQGNGTIGPYPEAKVAMEYLTEKNYSIGLIGQVERTERAINLLRKFDLYRFIQFIEFGMEKKLTLIHRVQSRANISLNNILFIEYDFNKVESDEVLDILYDRIFLMYIDDYGIRKKYIKHALFVFDQRPKAMTGQREQVTTAYDRKQQQQNMTKRPKPVRPRFVNTTSNKKPK